MSVLLRFLLDLFDVCGDICSSQHDSMRGCSLVFVSAIWLPKRKIDVALTMCIHVCVMSNDPEMNFLNK